MRKKSAFKKRFNRFKCAFDVCVSQYVSASVSLYLRDCIDTIACFVCYKIFERVQWHTVCARI
jgi:hypothetical protein